MKKTAVIIGRWQIFHNGHKALLERALKEGEDVIVVVGTSFRSRSVKNPFTFQERVAMIKASLNPEDLLRVKFLPVRDFQDDVKWRAAVQTGVASLATNKDIVLVGHSKDSSSYYLNLFRDWSSIEIDPVDRIDATDIRSIYFESRTVAAAISVLEPYVPVEVADYLQAWSKTDHYLSRREEHLATELYKKEYPAPFYFTADAVVIANGHVLMITRDSRIGRGQLALPGGYVKAGESGKTAAIRELKEETNIGLMDSDLTSRIESTLFVDNPVRSARGRMLTCAFFINLGELDKLPEVKGRSHLSPAQWIPLSKIPELEHTVFEDHALIVDKFYKVFE